MAWSSSSVEVFWKPAELDVADALGRVDDLGPGDALDVDVAADQPDRAALAVAPEDLEVDARPLGPLEPVGGLVEAEPLDRPGRRP